MHNINNVYNCKYIFVKYIHWNDSGLGIVHITYLIHEYPKIIFHIIFYF